MKKTIFKLLGLGFMALMVSISACKKDKAPKTSPPSISTKPATGLTSNSAVSGAIITSDGGSAIIQSGICWGTTADITVENSAGKTIDGIKAVGDFNTTITGLTPNSTYFVRAYATNALGTSYGATFSFITLANAPTVTTADLLNITPSSALAGGNITSNGGLEITESGVCWSTNADPTTNSSKLTTNGIKSGNYSITITDLNPGTKYYVRAYATNAVGTTYGENKSFNTSAIQPTLGATLYDTANAKDFNITGNITNNGGSNITEMGICWSLNPNPTIADNFIIVSPTVQSGGFTGLISNVANGTTVYVRAYAQNAIGIAYGSETSFTGGVF